MPPCFARAPRSKPKVGISGSATVLSIEKANVRGMITTLNSWRPRVGIMPIRIAVLDDYQGVARRMADWDRLRDAAITFFDDHIADAPGLIERLKPFDAVCL